MKGEEAWSRIERIHRPHLAEGDKVHLHFLPLESGTIKNPRIPGATSYYAIVNGLRVEFPVYVNAGDMVTIVGVRSLTRNPSENEPGVKSGAWK